MNIPYRRVAERGIPARDVEWPPPIGSELREIYGNFNDILWHVRGHVDIEEAHGGLVVRCWRYTRRSWHYEVFNYIQWFAASGSGYLFVVTP